MVEPDRGFVLFQRTQAAAALQVEKNRPEDAIDELVFWRRAGARLLECLEKLPAAQKTITKEPFWKTPSKGCARA